MAKTCISANAAYCTVAQFLGWFDARTVGDLVQDDGTRNTSLTNNPVLLQLLQEASGDVEAAVLLGNRYAVADLQALTGNSQLFLAGIVAGLAMLKLLERRPELELPVPERSQRAERLLQALSVGERIFAFQETASAGEIEEDHETPHDVDNRSMVSYHARRYLGRRANRYPTQANVAGDFT